MVASLPPGGHIGVRCRYLTDAMATIIFNSPSVETLLDQRLPGPVIGCNWMFQRRRLDHCVVFDWQTRDQIDRFRQLHQNTQFWASNGRGLPGWSVVGYPMSEQATNSGTCALWLAHNLGLRSVWVIGCGWGVSDRSLFDYGTRNSQIKYSNSQKRLVERLQKPMRITFVTDHTLDVPGPQITTQQFLEQVSLEPHGPSTT